MPAHVQVRRIPVSEELGALLFEVFIDSASDKQIEALDELLKSIKSYDRQSLNMIPFCVNVLQGLQEAVEYRSGK